MLQGYSVYDRYFVDRLAPCCWRPLDGVGRVCEDVQYASAARITAAILEYSCMAISIMVAAIYLFWLIIGAC